MSDWRHRAQQLDEQDPLKGFRDRFLNRTDEIYLDGNSLGKLPLGVAEEIQEAVQEQWGHNLIRSWNDSWLAKTEQLNEKFGQLLNASSKEIIVGESTSVRLYQITQALVNAKRYPPRLVTDSLNFPTDVYILDSISQQAYGVPLTQIEYKESIEPNLEQLQSKMQSEPGIYCLSLVTYKSGYAYPMLELNKFAEAHNSIILWDLSHAVGVLDIDFKATETKVAFGCTYKYLNGGPGSPAFLYMATDLLEQTENPIAGWFGHARPFDFGIRFEAAEGIQKMAIGTPSMLSLIALEKGLDITLEAGLKAIREKSTAQTAFLWELLHSRLASFGLEIESPESSDHRGAHLSVSHSEAWRIAQALQKGTPAIIPDFRPDRFIRLGIAPLYTRFQDLLITVDRLEAILEKKEYVMFSTKKPQVT
jgi:kynureninase